MIKIVPTLFAEAKPTGRRNWDEPVQRAALARIAYHGIALLLSERNAAVADWPSLVSGALRDEALARSMWEVRHRAILVDLIDRLGAAGIEALLLKGTAAAYDLYANSAARIRGDTDLLVREQELTGARRFLEGSGFRCQEDEDGVPVTLRSQESWAVQAGDGSHHVII